MTFKCGAKRHGQLARVFNYQGRIARATATFITILLLGFALVAGCDSSSKKDDEVILYTSVDEPIARAIVAEFERASEIKVTIVTDTEATKSVGLAERIRAEHDRPRGDVFWANEVFNTINLADEGLLASYESPTAHDVPQHFRDEHFRWTGTGIRRVIVVAGDDIKVEGIEDLADPKFKGKIAIARPTAGTTGGHVAALYSIWGDDLAKKFFHRLRDNDVKLLGGNSIVAEQVARGGTIALGLSDNDDVEAAREQSGNAKLRAILPDQKTLGTLAIPTAVALINGAPHPQPSQKLINFLLSPQVEKRLIEKKFAGWSVRVHADGDSKDAPVRWMPVDYHAVAKAMPAAIRSATAILEGRE